MGDASLDGSVRDRGRRRVRRGGAGDVFRFDPDERHSLASDGGRAILLLLAPWPGEGHYRGSAA